MPCHTTQFLCVYCSKENHSRDPTVVIGSQSRTLDDDGAAAFEADVHGETSLTIIRDGKEYIVNNIQVADGETFELKNAMLKEQRSSAIYPSTLVSPPVMLVSGIVVLVVGVILVIAARKIFDPIRQKRLKLAALVLFITGAIAGTYGFTGLTRDTVLVSNTFAAEEASLGKPTNVQVFGDDQIATVYWDAPANAAAQGIIGYRVRWGKASDGRLTNSKDTIHTITQIQPLVNGEEYIVEVQSVKGRYISANLNGSGGLRHSLYPQGESRFGSAEGPVSYPVQMRVTPTDARVKAMRARLTGFFDDFNDRPAGNFDEKKWNNAYSLCSGPGQSGSYVNSQFHAHTQVSTV